MFKNNIFENDIHWGIEIIPRRFYCCGAQNATIYRFKREYPRSIRRAMIYSLIFIIGTTLIWRRVHRNEKVLEQSKMIFSVEEIPQTRQEMRAPAPARPTVPIASEDEDLPEDLTIEDTDLNINAEAPPVPPPPVDDMQLFVPYDEPPMPEGGMAAIQANVLYPEIAQRSGVEGTVILRARIDENGNVGRVVVLQSLFEACDEAAMKAVRSVKWKPAKQRDMPVAVWVSVAIEFDLEE